jgi:hypothetical protein
MKPTRPSTLRAHPVTVANREHHGSGAAQCDAVAADRANPFTHKEMFIGSRPPTTPSGAWDAREPLAAAAIPVAA